MAPPGRDGADRALPGHRRSGSYQVTARPAGRLSRPPAGPGPAVRVQDTRSAVSYDKSQDRDQRQDATSLCEGCCGSPEDNPVHIRKQPRPDQSWKKCYDKRDYVFNGTLTVAAIMIWLRDIVQEPSDTP